MDPYDTLGVPRCCTSEELQEAFRAKARLAHPDRGGEPGDFIRLRQAFDQIRKELERRPPDPVGRDASATGSPRSSPQTARSKLGT